MSAPKAYRAGQLFDGTSLSSDQYVLVDGGRVSAITGRTDLPDNAEIITLGPGILAPGYVDLQVNGGGGLMFNADPSPDTLRTMAASHASLGATSILPTLITDTPDITARAIDAAVQATRQGVEGIAGLHLEGPHLSVARKGAHDPSLIRPMEQADLERLCAAAEALPLLKTTVAPESVTCDQIETLTKAGVLVSIGHSNCDYDTAIQAARAGARCVTHLFNAMSPFGHRDPGLVGAAVDTPGLSAGLIADLIHVHPAAIRAVLAAKATPGALFLVSDAMATAGTSIDEFTLNGRRIERRENRLTLEDGTLAGAHLDLSTAVANLVSIGCPLQRALAMATRVPADLIGEGHKIGRLAAGSKADMILLHNDLSLARVWQNGTEITPFRD